MTTWKDNGSYGSVKREIVNENGQSVCAVWVEQYGDGNSAWPWSEGKENFRLILKVPQMLAALEAIVDLPTDDLWRCYGIATAAIAAMKGKDEETNT